MWLATNPSEPSNTAFDVSITGIHTLATDSNSINSNIALGDIVTVTLYPIDRDIDDVNGTGVDQWEVDTSQWFDITDYLRSTLCVECGEYKPDDDRVFGGMKCGECAYGWQGQDPHGTI